jgi:hypothetical protein
VKLPFSHHQRRGLVPLVGLALAAYYLLVMLPLSRRAARLDQPLHKAWQKLSASLGQTNATTIDFLHITNQLNATRLALVTLENARQQATARLQLGRAVRARMQADFVNANYDNERAQVLTDLSSLAKKQHAVVEPAVFAGFPEYTSDVQQPSLLWAALSMTDNLLQTALQCGVGTIQSLVVPPVLTNPPPTNATALLAEIPLQVEFTGSATSVTRLLQCLPLRADEIREAGLPAAPPDKPPLFVDRLIVQKQSPDKPDEVHVLLGVVGFVLRE